MTSTKRALSALATGALALPFIYAPAAYAVAPEPPAQQSIADFCSTLPASYDPFTDDEPNTFTEAIECIAFAGIAQGGPRGLPSNQYGPAFAVPRDQMASFIARMIDAADELDEGDNIEALPGYDGSNAFTDVPANNVHIQNINRLEAAGIVEGGPGGRPANQYGPGLDVTRAQMASFINRAIGYMTGTPFSSTNDYFTDDEAFQAHEANINGIASEGIAVGDGQDIYRPGQPIQRDQMAGFIARTLAVLHEDGLISEVTQNAAQPQNRVTLTSNSVQQGGAVTGTVTDATSATVSGCGLTDQALTDNDASTAGIQFSFNLPQSQAAGTNCTLTFTITRPNGATATETESITVTGQQTGGAAVTAGPELVSAAITAAQSPTNPAVGVVTYTFDEDVTGRAATPGGFHIYRFDGTQFDASAVRIEGNRVLAEFPAGQLSNITLATVDFGAVADVSGQVNPEGATGVQNVTQAAGITAAPDLASVTNFRTNIQGQVLVDFVFDEAVANIATAGIPAAADATRFELVLIDGTFVEGNQATVNSDDRRIVTVRFTQSSTDLPQSQVARGVVESDTVFDAQGNSNPLQAADVNNAGNTVEPDLASARAISTTQVEYTFDQPVSSVNLDRTRFFVYDADSNEFTAASVTRSQQDSRVVIATFAAAQVSRAVGASVEVAAVRASENENQAGLVGFNERDEVPLQQVGFEAGRTTLPDLTSVRVLTDPVSQNTIVRYTFDQNVTPALFECRDFRLYDANNAQFTAVAGCQITAVDGDLRSVDVRGGFTTSQTNAAVLGTVNDASDDVNNGNGDSVDAGSQPAFPEYDQPVTRS